MSKLSTPEHTGYTMPLSVEQIIHQSDADTPLKTWVSPKMPKAIQQAFMLTIANPYLREAALAGSLLKAAYLRQLSADELLFGWVYTDESQSGQGKFTSTFICYFFNQPLEAPELELIFECLEAGPVVSSQGLKDEDAIDPLTIRDSTYTPARSGIPIPSNVTALNRLLLYKKKLLHCFIPYEEQPIPSKAKLAGMQHSALPSESIATTNFPLESLTLNLNNKGALLVGTSEHQLGVQPLPGVKKDIASLQKVLVDPKKGNFAVVDVLLNSDSPAMAAKIEDFFSNRASESLALLYFSGYAVLDRQGTLYLSTAESRRNTQGKIIRSTFISSDFLGAVLRDSPAQQRVIILDICMSRESSPILGGSHKLLETARQHLSGPGLTLLISSAAFHDTNVQKGVQPSIYTYYLVEGLETGIADSNGTGIITLSKWHTYAKQKVQIASPALRPVFYGPLDQKQLPIARVPINDARLQYRREVERLSRSGQISLVHQLILDNLQKKLNLNASDCAEVKAEVLKPYNDYRYKLKRYALTYLSRVNQSGKEQYSSTPQIDYLQNLLGLTDVDTEPIKSEIFQQLHTIPMPEIAETTSTSSALGYKGRIPLSVNFGLFWVWVNTLRTSLFQVATEGYRRWTRRRSLGSVSQPQHSWKLALQGMAVDAKTLLVFLLLGLITIWSISALLAEVRRRQEQSLAERQLQAWVQHQNYKDCTALSNKLSPSSKQSARIQGLMDQCRMGWRWQSAKVGALINSSGALSALAFRPKRQMLVGGGEDGLLQLWSVASQNKPLVLDESRLRIWSVAFNREGRLLVSGGADQTLSLWNAATGQLVRTFKGHQGTIWSAAFHPNGQLVASGSQDGTIKLWQVASGTLYRTLKPQSGAVRAIAFRPDTQALISAGASQTITIWESETGQLSTQLVGHKGRVVALAVSKDGKRLASSSVDRSIKIWNLDTAQVMRTIATPDLTVETLAFNADNTTLAGGGGQTVWLWNAETGQSIYQFSGSSSRVTATAFSPDGRQLAIARENKLLSLLTSNTP